MKRIVVSAAMEGIVTITTIERIQSGITIECIGTSITT